MSESSGGGGVGGFKWRGLVDGAEKTANEVNSQFGRFCHKLTGEKDKVDETVGKTDGDTAAKEKKEPSGIMRQLSDIGSKSYGLLKDIETKFDHGKSRTTAEKSTGDTK